ncbi:ubiquitin-specific protease doa4 [Savitreella phatthalungensis]
MTNATTSFEALQARGEIKEEPDSCPIESWLQVAKSCYRNAQLAEEDGNEEQAFVYYAQTYEIMTNKIPKHTTYSSWKAANKPSRGDYLRFRGILADGMDDYAQLMRSLRARLRTVPQQRQSISGGAVTQTHRSSTTQGLIRSPPIDGISRLAIDGGVRPGLQAARSSLPAAQRTANGKLEPGKTNVIEPATLMQLMRQQPSTTILFLDVRPRELFDQAHIDADAVANIDPLVCRANIQAQDLEDSFLVAPSEELALFERRNEFNYVIFYDDDSVSMVPPAERAQQSQHQILHNLFTGLWANMGWRKPLARPPMLLVGGLQAWQRLNGPVKRADPHDGKSQVVLVRSPSNELAKGDQKLINRRTNIMQTPYPRSVHEYIAAFSDNSYRQSMARLNYEQNQRAKEPKVYSPTSATEDSPRSAMPLSVVHPDLRAASRHTPPYPRSPASTTSTSGDPYLSVRQPPAQVVRTGPVYTRQPSLGSQQSRFGHTAIGKTGLRNLGNSCFMNATIQCLAACFPLARYLTSGKYKDDINPSNPLGYKGIIATKFAGLLRDMASDDNTVLAPTELRNAIGKFRPEFASGNQEDAQELLVFLLDGLHEDLNANALKPQLRELTEAEEERRETMPDAKVSSIEWERYCHRNRSVVTQLLQGQYQSRLKCLTCGQTSTTYNAFTTLSLPIPKKSIHSGGGPGVTLEDCVEEFCKTEAMEGDDSWFCSRCKQLRRASKKLSISRMPDVLLVHFKRFESKGPWRDKINTPIHFPTNGLDMTRHVMASAVGGGAGGNRSASSLSGSTAVYDLFGIVYHRGSMEGGHYTAACTAPEATAYPDWTLFDDSRIAPVDNNDLDARAAYLLFYQRRPDAKF